MQALDCGDSVFRHPSLLSAARFVLVGGFLGRTGTAEVQQPQPHRSSSAISWSAQVCCVLCDSQVRQRCEETEFGDPLAGFFLSGISSLSSVFTVFLLHFVVFQDKKTMPFSPGPQSPLWAPLSLRLTAAKEDIYLHSSPFALH